MHTFLNHMFHYLHMHPQLGEFFAFIVALLESLPIAGTIIPGSLTMTAVGFMIGSGAISAYLTLFLASLGAFLGDMIGYTCGRVFKDKIRNVWPFRKYPKIITLSEHFIKKHGGKSILIGRFVGAVRSAVPMVAGLLRLSWVRFVTAALPTAILWAIVYSLPGMALGAFSTEIPAKLLSEYLGIGIGVVFILWFIYWLVQRFFINLTDFYHRKIDCCWQWLNTHKGSNLLIKYIYNRQNTACHDQLSRCLLGASSLIIFLVIFLNVIFQTSFLDINPPLFHLAQSLRIYHLDPFFITLTLFGNPISVAFIAFIISLGLVLSRQWRAAAHLCIATIATIGIVYAIKIAYYNPRPFGFMEINHTSSFPSGHTALSAVVFGLLAFYTAQLFKSHRGIIYLIASLVVGLIALSRLYLGSHWALDVLASIFLGLSIVLATIIHHQRLPKPTSKLNIQRWIWTICILIIIIASWSLTVYRRYTSSITEYKPSYPVIMEKSAAWWQNPFTVAPLYRVNRFGFPAQPFNIQWAGPLTTIKQTLLAHHWHRLTRKDHLQDTVQRLASKKPQYHLPLLEMLYHNKRPELVFYQTIPHKKSVHILRLWDSNVRFENHTKLWLGMMNELIPPHDIVTFYHRSLMSFTKLNLPEDIYGTSKHWQAKLIQTKKSNIPKHLHAYHWDGKVWLLLGVTHGHSAS